MAWMRTVIVGIGEIVARVVVVVILCCRPNLDTDCYLVTSWYAVQTIGRQRPRTLCRDSRLSRT